MCLGVLGFFVFFKFLGIVVCGVKVIVFVLGFGSRLCERVGLGERFSCRMCFVFFFYGFFCRFRGWG